MWQRLSAEELTDNLPPARFRVVMGRVGGVIEAGCEWDEAQFFLQQRITEIGVNGSRQFWVAALGGAEVQLVPHGEIVDRIVVPEQQAVPETFRGRLSLGQADRFRNH